MSLLSRSGAKVRFFGAVALIGLLSACGGSEGGPEDGTKDPIVEVPDSESIEPGSRGFMEDCTKPEDCATGVCQTYPGKGKTLCTMACSESAPCPAPSPGCNNQRVCKAP